jgi:hypothetical protein
MTPVFKVGLEPIHGITIRVSFGPRKFTNPVVDVADLMDCVKAAVREVKAPKEQAIAVSEIVQGRDVILVGSIQKVSSNKSGATFMEIDGFSLIDAPDKFDWFSTGAPAASTDPQATTTSPVSQPAASEPSTSSVTAAAAAATAAVAAGAAAVAAGAAAVSPAAAPEAEHKKKKDKTPAAKKEAAAAPAVTPSPAGAPQGVTKFDDVKSAILAYCEKLNMKPAQLTVESVKDLVCPAAKAGVIEAALDEIVNP